MTPPTTPYARLWVATVIATVSSEGKGALARAAGADHVIDYTTGDPAASPGGGGKKAPIGLIIGIVAGAVCYVAAVKIKHALGYDDSLDAFGVHGVGGFVGAVLTGLFADAAINPASEGATIGKQFFGAAITVVYTAIATAIILYVVKAIMGLRTSKQAEIEGLDIALHGESVQ